jgi:hypothetical protein
MENKILLISDFNEQSWSFETALKEGTGAEVMWVTVNKGNTQKLPLKFVDLAVIDIDKLDLDMLMSIGFQTPVILLVESLDEIQDDLFATPDTVVLERNCKPHELMAAVDLLCDFEFASRRNFNRYPGKHEAVLQCWNSDELSPGRVLDISLGGVRVKVQGYNGRVLDILSIHIHDQNARSGELTGRVVWMASDEQEQNSSILGIQFLSLDEAKASHN